MRSPLAPSRPLARFPARVGRSAAPLLLAILMLTAGCATTASSLEGAAAQPVASDSGTPAAELRLGYFPNLTHATAVYGVSQGVFADALGSTRLTPQTFTAGPAAVEALFAGAIDAAYLGPNPAVNAYIKSGGQALRVVAGATSGGAALVVRPEITDVAQLRGARLATPQTGGTQDIALRHLLSENGFEVDERGAGDVTIEAQDNAQTLALFRAGDLDGAWVPEPWASRMVLEADGSVLVDEADLWPGGRFVTTHLVVRTEYLTRHPQTVKALIAGSVAANRRIAADETQARAVLDEELEALTGKRLGPQTMARAFDQLELTDDPLASTLTQSAQHAFDTGLVDEADLTGIYDLTLLREVLGQPVDDAGLGVGR